MVGLLSALVLVAAHDLLQVLGGEHLVSIVLLVDEEAQEGGVDGGFEDDHEDGGYQEGEQEDHL